MVWSSVLDTALLRIIAKPTATSRIADSHIDVGDHHVVVDEASAINRRGNAYAARSSIRPRRAPRANVARANAAAMAPTPTQVNSIPYPLASVRRTSRASTGIDFFYDTANTEK